MHLGRCILCSQLVLRTLVSVSIKKPELLGVRSGLRVLELVMIKDGKQAGTVDQQP